MSNVYLRFGSSVFTDANRYLPITCAILIEAPTIEKTLVIVFRPSLIVFCFLFSLSTPEAESRRKEKLGP